MPPARPHKPEAGTPVARPMGEPSRDSPGRKVRNKTERVVDSSRRANAEANKAARLRRKYERSEVRRFTRRSRHRRLTWLTIAASIVVLCVLVAVAVYSPLLALKTIKIEGAASVSATEVRTALADQLGTPLALVDFDGIKKELARFPLIRSYVTETVPPNTLVIHIVERAPLGVLQTATGYTVVDAAGVTLSHETERPAKLPIIDSGSTSTTTAAFTAAVSVMLALPASVSSRVDTVKARTKDDVTLVLDGAGQSVVWGSAERSAEKARVLADLISHQDPKTVVEYDVSAPNSAVVRPGS
ncbi:MAG: FtsQ-type POTRA domain-containing protein [Lacisediminihabitans sp.]